METETKAAYDAIAEWYDAIVRKGVILSANHLILDRAFEMAGSLNGQTICDLACGQGNIARQMARLGATVVGVDLSAKLLDIARQEEEFEPLGISYIQADAANLAPLQDQSFDGVLCNFALMDMPDLDRVLGEVKRVLKNRGWFLAVITHPCFQGPPGRSYHDEGHWRSDYAAGVRGQVGAHHRTLSTYLTALGATGLVVVEAMEPRISGAETPPVLILKSVSSSEV